MEEHGLLVRHLTGWAETKRREVDAALVATALDLRHQHDELELGDWPAGSVERLLLVTWPGYGDQLPDPDALATSLDTLWRFLRATGRMRAHSATPAALNAEARRALPEMAAAMADPGRHSSGRVLADFGKSIGIDLEGAVDLDELQGRLNRIQTAWNALTIDERRRLMPDPSPKGAVGQRFTNDVMGALGSDQGPGPLRGDPARAAADARSSRFVRQCLALADWVGEGKEVTAIGVLRPAVAREAYRDLDLWAWEREHQAVRLARHAAWTDRQDPEAERLLAESAASSWSSAGDCFALDRLWYAVESAGLVEVGSRRAKTSGVRPESDEEWLKLAHVLLLGLCLRVGGYRMEPLIGVLVMALEDESGTGSVSMAEVSAQWMGRAPVTSSLDEEFMRELWGDRLSEAFSELDDTSVWERDEARVQLTDLGREFSLVLMNAVHEGMFDGDDHYY
jgi:hypothetical protein